MIMKINLNYDIKLLNNNKLFSFKNINLFFYLFFGDWGLGIGDWGLGIGPNPQSTIPNPQSPIHIKIFNL